jgi:hypothetical protein
MAPFFVRPDTEGARARIVDAVLEAAGRRDVIGDSDLDGEQPVSVNVVLSLGDLRRAGLRYAPRVEDLLGSGDPLDRLEGDTREGALESGATVSRWPTRPCTTGAFVLRPWNQLPWVTGPEGRP